MGFRKGGELNNNEFIAFSTSDSSSLFELDRICRLSPWSYEGFHNEMQQPYTYCWGKKNGFEVSAFIMSHILLDEAHILKLGVLPSMRRQGLATRLLEYSIERFKQLHVGSAYLEVRRSQTSAQALYEKSGFVRSGERKDYYGPEEGVDDKPEDAILYTLVL